MSAPRRSNSGARLGRGTLQDVFDHCLTEPLQPIGFPSDPVECLVKRLPVEWLGRHLQEHLPACLAKIAQGGAKLGAMVPEFAPDLAPQIAWEGA